MASLLSKSLGDVKNQEKPTSGRRGGASGGNNNRNSPYAVSISSFAIPLQQHL